MGSNPTLTAIFSTTYVAYALRLRTPKICVCKHFANQPSQFKGFRKSLTAFLNAKSILAAASFCIPGRTWL